MIKLPASNIIYHLVEAMFPRFSSPDKGLYVNINAQLENLKTKAKAKQNIHFIFHRPNNYTRVFVYTSLIPLPFSALIPDNFDFVCDHDSVWVDSVNVILNSVYFELADKIREEDAPILMHDYCSCLVFSPKLVSIQVGNDSIDKENYRKKLTRLDYFTYTP